jgi:hypothetical protein
VTCRHTEFAAHTAVHRLLPEGASRTQVPVQFAVDLRIECVHCKMSLAFLGLPFGAGTEHPTVSVDCLEARLIAADPSVVVTPAQQLADEASQGSIQ